MVLNAVLQEDWPPLLLGEQEALWNTSLETLSGLASPSRPPKIFSDDVEVPRQPRAMEKAVQQKKKTERRLETPTV